MRALLNWRNAQLLGSLPSGNKLTKKLDALYGSIRKLETILYELSLAKASPVGKRPGSTAAGDEPRDNGEAKRARPDEDGED